jgi:CDP-paratose 2-epimerase
VFPAGVINGLPRIERETRWDWDPDSQSLVVGFDPVHGIDANFSMDGPSKTIYGASKAAADFFCQEYVDAFDLPVIVNRCGVIAGSGQFGVANQGWFTFWAISCLFERPLTYLGFKGKQVRDILFIDDLCSLIDIQLQRLPMLAGKVWNVGGGRDNSVSLIEATHIMERTFQKTMDVTISDEIRKGDMVIYITDNRAVSEELKWRPTVSLTQGADRIARWLRDSRAELEKAGL